MGDDDNEIFEITYVGTGGAEIGLEADGDLLLNASNGDNVCIGNTSPTAKLDITGDLRVSTNITASGNISSSGTITMLTASIGGGIFTSASLAAGGGGGGSMDNFTLTADGGSNQTIADGNTLDIAGGDGITTAVEPIDTVTVNVDASQDGHISSILTTDLKLGEDAQTKIDFETNNEIHFDVNNAELFNMTGNQLSGSGVSTGSFGRLDATSLPNIGYANFTGSVGIGTTSPGEKLEVIGNISASGELSANTIVVGSTISHIGDTNTLISFGTDTLTFKAGNESFITITEDGSQDNIVIGDGGDIDFHVKAGGDNTLFAQGSSQRIGIGTATPTSKLQVVGDITATHITASGNISASGYISSSGVTISEQGDLRLIGGANNIIFGEPGDTTSQNYGIKTDGNLFLDIDKDNDNTGNFFQFRSNQASTNIMRMKDTGEVGIGTTTPPKTLTVAGEISASGNITTPSTGSVGNLIATTIEGTLSDSSRTDINSILATDLVLGEDAQTKIDFETANEIHFDINNSELFNMTGNELSGSDSSTGSFASLNVRGSVQDNLTIDGTLFATKKSFLIPRPEGGKLEYGVLEGQQNDVFFRGELKGDNVIYLPKEWEWLVDENTITVQLTSIGNYQELFVKEIKDNKIFIHMNGAFKTKKDIHCYHIIHGTRKDVELIRNYQ